MSNKKTQKRIISVLMLMLMLLTSLGLAPEIREEAYAETSSSVMIGGPDSLKEGVNTENARLVHYGDRYWYVIGYDREGVAAGSGEITLLSRDSIKSTPFDKNYNAVYSSSNLKKDIEAYANEKLSAGEKSAIASRDLSAINARQQGDLKWWFENFRTVDEVLDNPVQGAMLWPLSAKEASAVNANIRKTGTGYWLRSLGAPEYKERYWYGLEEFDEYVVPAAMATVWDDGSVDIQAEKENTTYWHGMRPAFKLNKNNIVMVSAASDGKESEEDGTLTEAGAVTEKNLKLTLKDDVHKDFYVNPCDVEPGERGSLTVKYRNAIIGENEYISAVIKGADGSIKQYGRLAKVTSENGTATIKGLPTDASGKVSLPEGDKIYVFNEQYNGDEKTDYVSNLREISLTGHNWVFDDIKYNTLTGAIEVSYHCSIDGNHFITIEKGEYTTERTEPTCEEPGKEYQVVSISAKDSLDGKEHKKSKYITDYTPALGHVYNRFFGFRWTGDASAGYSNAEAIFGCTRDYSHVKYVKAVVTSNVQEPTCTAIGRTLYQATLSADESPDRKDHGEAKYAKAKPRLGHDWGDVNYIWSGDNRTVTATRVCKRDESHVETETVGTEVTNITTAPTCVATGVGNIKTKPFTNEAFSEQTKNGATIPVDSDAHDWDDGEEVETAEVCGGKAILFKCNLCGETRLKATSTDAHQWTENKVEYREPTCTEMGEKMYQCTVCHMYDLESMETTNPIGHKWKFVNFTWTGNETDGYGMAVANYVCENDDSHTMTVNAEITSVVTDPTCKAGGKTVYTATVSASASPDGAEHSESKDAQATQKVDHDWEYNGMEWTGNKTSGYTKAVAKYSCKYNCGEEEEVEAELTEKVTEADCEHKGKTTYTAKVTADKSLTGVAHTGTKDAKITEALGHNWQFSEMIWTGNEESGYTNAKAKFVCERDKSHTKLVDAELTSTVHDATCTEDGFTSYTATIESSDSPSGKKCSDHKTAKIVKATGHAWKLKDFTWTAVSDKRGFTASANYVCDNDTSHTASVGADMRITEKAATCEEAGGTLYTATVKEKDRLSDEDARDVRFVEETEPTGHKWGDPEYIWSKDNKTVTAKAVCEHDSSHTISETVNTTSEESKQPTCASKGETTYTAEFTKDAFKKQTKKAANIDIVPDAHDWNDPTYEWADDYSTVTAKRVCKNDPAHIEKETVDTQAEDIRKATCSSEGEKKYTASFKNRAFKNQEKTVEIPIDPSNHNWNGGEEISSQDICGGKGMKYTCNNCSKIKIEGSREHEWEDKWTYYPEPTCTESGQRFHKCKKCDAFNFEYFEVLEPLGHDWSEPSYTWAADNSTVTAKRVCKRDASHVEEEKVNTTSKVSKKATCTSKGETTYTAAFENEAFKTQTKTAANIDIDSNAHDWNDPTYGWSNDYGTVTATRVCKHDPSHVETETVNTQAVVTKEATCVAKGRKDYTASFTNQAFKEQKKTVVTPIDPRKHHWDEGVVISSQDICGRHGKLYTCRLCEEFKVEGSGSHDWETAWTFYPEPTCTESGQSFHKCKKCDAFDLNNVDVLKPIGHDWGEPSYTWSDDYSTVTAKRVCNRDASHVEEEKVKTTSKVIEAATCEKGGKNALSAEFENAAFEKQTKSVRTAALGHQWSEWVVTKEPTTTEKGEEVRTCSACKKTETRAIPKIDPTRISYRTTDGDQQTWYRGSGVTADFTFKRSMNDEETFSHFTGIRVDGRDVDRSDYTAESGSVIVKLKPAYLETLSTGEHTITALFDDGNGASAKFTVVDKNGGGRGTNTGDSSALLSWLAVMLFAALALTIAALYRRKRS